MPSQQLLTALGEALGSGALVQELLASAGGSGSGAEIVATDPAYGVIGDGVADDTDALQAAIDAVELAGAGSVLVIPPGTYMVQDPTTASGVGSPLTLSGDDITVIARAATTGTTSATVMDTVMVTAIAGTVRISLVADAAGFGERVFVSGRGAAAFLFFCRTSPGV